MHELARLLGLTDAGGGWYLWWSGIAGDLTYLGILGVVWRRFNCHQQGCWRVALHHHDQHYCRKHHPSL
jgi:hypothetical protein